MLFNSFEFLIFLPVVFVIYHCSPKRLRWIVLLVSSYYFYMNWNVEYGLLILGTTITSFLFARLISHTSSAFRKKLYLGFTFVVCIGVLFVFKYFTFISNSIVSLFHLFSVPLQSVTLDLLLPVGISFYTFQTLAYVVDVYRGDVEAETHFGKYATFISFFPQLVAGPIERTSNLLPQIKDPQDFSYDKAIYGIKLMAWGFFKKVAVADTFAVYVDAVYSNPTMYAGFSLVLATLLFSIQIYCDFSGYSDIAVGTAKLFGIDLMQNFNSPYFSASIREFWSRWHISLSQWFRDYLYFPLGGNRCSKWRHGFNLMVTFLVSGLWHGANGTYLIWGGLHGAAQILEKHIDTKSKKATGFKKLVSTLFVFVFVTVAWVFFRAESISDAVYIIQNVLEGIRSPMAYILNGFSSLGITLMDLVCMLLPMLLCLGLYDYFNQKTNVIYWISTLPLFVRWTIYVGLFYAIAFFRPVNSGSEFIYFQF